jgi:hypothetical protein
VSPARRAGLALAGLALVAAGVTGMARAQQPAGVTARLGPITVSATALYPGPSGTLTASMRVSTASPRADQLDAAIAADGAAVAVYHQWVSFGTLTDLTDCGGLVAPPGVVAAWQHYGPLPVPGHSGGPPVHSDATLSVQPTAPPPGRTLAITLYFANAGSVVLRLPLSSA